TLVSGQNGDYDGSQAKLTRIVVQFKNIPLVLLIDRVNSKAKNQLKMEQNFNLASNVTVENQGEESKLVSEDEELTIKQFLPTSQKSIIEGSFEGPIAVNTTGFAKVEKTQQIKFNRATKQKNVFITGIYDERITGNVNVSIKNTILEVTVKDKTLSVYI